MTEKYRKPCVAIAMSQNERMWLTKYAAKYTGGKESTLLRLLLEFALKAEWPEQAEEIALTFSERHLSYQSVLPEQLSKIEQEIVRLERAKREQQIQHIVTKG